MKRRLITLSISIVATGTLAACLGDTARRVDCGSGSAYVYAGADYCIYASAIIIEGFDCPPALPFAFEANGAVVCSASETAPAGGWGGIVDAWRDDQDPSDASDTSDTTPAPRTACDLALDGPLGGAVDVVDVGSCTRETRCADGVIARCGNGLYACDCAAGEARCFAVAEATCTAHGGAIGASCQPALGHDACVADAFCAEDQRCAALPALCADGCYDDADCAGACAGGSRLTATIGRCVTAVAPGACWQVDDCPTGWSCDNAFVSCTPCAPCESPSHYPGQCRPPESGVGLVGDGLTVTPIWWVAAAYALLDCPSVTLELRDDVSNTWTPGPIETACDGASSPVFAMASARATLEVGASDFGWRWVRARGAYYTDCTGATVDTCASGRIEVVSEPVLLKP